MAGKYMNNAGNPATLRKLLLQNGYPQGVIMKYTLMNILAPPLVNRQNCAHNRAVKHIKISCLPRESSLNYS